MQCWKTLQNVSKNNLKTINWITLQKFENDDRIQFLNSYLKILTCDKISNFFSIFDFLMIKQITRFDSTKQMIVFKTKTNFQQNVDKTIYKNNNQFNFIVNKSKSTFVRIMQQINSTNLKIFKKIFLKQ